VELSERERQNEEISRYYDELEARQRRDSKRERAREAAASRPREALGITIAGDPWQPPVMGRLCLFRRRHRHRSCPRRPPLARNSTKPLPLPTGRRWNNSPS
jgi:hypothetical protein